MFRIDKNDKTIHLTRGDAMVIGVAMKDRDGNVRNFFSGDVVRFKVYEKKNAAKVVLQKELPPITEETDSVTIYLSNKDTKIGEEINKPKEYWYDIELNPDGDTQTIVGFDEDGAKVFMLYPEGGDVLEGEK